MPVNSDDIASIARALRDSRITVVLGAGASLDPNNDLCKDWKPETPGMPSGGQLAALLAREFGVQYSAQLSLTAQYAEVFGGKSDVRTKLNAIFSRSMEPLLCHSFCADFATWRAEQRRSRPQLTFPLFVTTNYDSLLEKALRSSKTDFDLLSYDTLPGSEKQTLFHAGHRGHSGGASEPEEILNTCTYDAVGTDLRTCVIKIHGGASGAAGRTGQRSPSFVITEDDYIGYLASVRWEEFFPAPIGDHLGECHYLFLGHSLLDWNLRVMLHQIMRKRWKGQSDYKIWAVRRNVESFESIWAGLKGIRMIDADLAEFIPELDRKVRGLSEAA
jgi:hypothetical protein